MTDAEFISKSKQAVWGEDFVRDMESASNSELLDAWRNRLSEEDRQYLLRHYEEQILPRLNNAHREEDHDANIASETEDKIFRPLYGVLFVAFMLSGEVFFDDGGFSLGLDKVHKFFYAFGIMTFFSSLCFVLYKLYKYFFR